DLFAAEDSFAAIAYLARVLRRCPTNRVAAERLYSALTYRSFGVPLILPTNSHYPFRPQYSPDGRRLAANCIYGQVSLLDPKSGEVMLNLPRHKDNVSSVEFSPDGQLVVTTSADGTAQMADVRTGQPVGSALQHTGFV